MRYAALAGLILTVLASSSPAAIKVTPSGHLFTPSAAQQDDLYHFLLGHHAPADALHIVQSAIWVDMKDAHNLVVTITEDAPAEILPCVAIVTIGGATGGIIETKKGDGAFNGAPTGVTTLPSGGTALMFHGTQSHAAAMKLHVALKLQQHPQ